jgi:hypothetical protein
LKDDGASFDSRFDGIGPFRDTAEAGGISLESALRDFGPAAIDDLIPRIRALAAALDAAHAAGAVHGALHPSKVIIADDSTSLIAGTASSAPYVAPEVTAGSAPTPASDQFSLAAITYEWLFGRRIELQPGRPVEVRSMPGVDRAALLKAFTKALAAKPEDRFESCGDFCHRLTDAVVPELPLLAFEAEPETPIRADETSPIDTSFAEEIRLAPDFDAPPVDEPRVEPVTATIVERAEPSSIVTPPPSRASEPARFSGAMLILALLVGGVFGFAAGYMARPRALQSAPPQSMATAPGTESAVEPKNAVEAPKPSSGSLLVRSNPSGANVTVDGLDRGVTPLTLRDLELGTRAVIVARRGYIPETRTVAITSERPSRSLDVRLTAQAAAATQKSTPPAPKPVPPTSKPVAATGTMVVESRPAGASVTVNGTARGVTPLTIDAIAPGDYRIVMSMKGFVNFVTTVRVVAGERVRAAASLTAQEQE